MSRRSGQRRSIRESSGSSVANQLIGMFGVGAAGGIQGLYLALGGEVTDIYKTISGTAVTSWHDLSGLGRHATQGTGSMQPAWDPAAHGGKPGITGDAGDLLATANINLTTFERGALVFLIHDHANTGTYCPGFYGAAATAGSIGHMHREVANRLSGRGFGGGSASESRATPFNVATTPGVVTVTLDYTLTTQATRIRYNGADVTTSFDVDPNMSAATMGNTALNLLNRNTADLGLNGHMMAAILLAWPVGTAIPTGQLTAAENLLRTTWGV